MTKWQKLGLVIVLVLWWFTPRPEGVYLADPTGGILTSIAIAAIVSAAQYGLQYLLTPKPKPIERGKLSGEVQVQDSNYGNPIPIILGGGPELIDQCSGGFNRSIFTDGFTRNDDTDLGDAPNGETWTEFGPTGDGWGILNNEAVIDVNADGGGFAVVESGISDGSVSVRIKDVTAGGNLNSASFGVVFRWVDSSNYWYVTYSRFGEFLRLFKVVAGTPDGGMATGPGGLDLQDDDVIKVTFCGTEISGYVNDVAQWTAPVTNSTHLTGTKVGMQAGAGVTTPDILYRFDDFTVKGVREVEASAGGGIRIAGNVIYLSDIRKVVTTTPGQGGKGQRGPATQTTAYFADIAIKFCEGEQILQALFADSEKLLEFRSTSGATGAINTETSGDDGYDYLEPPDPSDTSITDRTEDRYSASVEYDADGVLTGTLTTGESFRFYSGTRTQEPDPVLEAYYQSLFPDEFDDDFDVTPAHRDDCYLVIENFNISTYGRIPSLSAILSNRNVRTAAECVEFLANRVGIESSEIDVTDIEAINIRGLLVTDSPDGTVALIGAAYNFDTIDANGVITTVARGGAIAGTIAVDDLGAVSGDRQPSQAQSAIELDLLQLPQRLDVSCFDPHRDGERSTSGWGRTETDSTALEGREFPIALTQVEGDRLARRLLTQLWADQRQKRTCTVSHTYYDLQPASRWTLQRTLDNATVSEIVRIKDVNGFLPGIFEVAAVVETGDTFEDTHNDDDVDPTPPPPSVPATSVVTFIDRLLRDRERDLERPGFYVGACSFGNGTWGGAALKRDRGAGYELVVNLPEQCTIGRCVDGTDLNTGDTFQVDLYGTLELPTYTVDEVAAGAGYVIVDDEIFQYQTATQLSTTPNRWELTDLSNRGANCSEDFTASHVTNGRFAVLDQSLRFVSIDTEMVGVGYPYIAVTSGQRDEDAGIVNFTCNYPDEEFIGVNAWVVDPETMEFVIDPETLEVITDSC